MKKIKLKYFKDINKSYTEGIYNDSSNNKKLGRVGMSYSLKEDKSNIDTKSEMSLKNGIRYAFDRKNKVLLNAFNNDKLVNNDLKKVLLSNPDNDYGIDILNNRIVLNGNIYINPTEESKKVINIKTRSNEFKKEDEYHNSKEYKDYLELKDQTFNNINKLDNFLFNSNNKYDGYLTSKINENILNKREWEYSNKYSDLKSKDKEKRIHILFKKQNKDQLNPLINIYNKLGIKTKKEKYNLYSLNKEETNKIKNWIVNSPRQEFYKNLKIENSEIFSYLINYRFLKKYNKSIANISNWNNQQVDLDKGEYIGKIDLKKRDNALDMCNQIEYAVDDLLGDEKKKLFINNPNLNFIEMKDSDFNGGCWYNGSNKSIVITDSSINLYYNRKYKDYPTLAKEKFLVQTFLHELGHSTEKTVYEKDIKDYKDFGKLIGWNKNYDYTIYKDSIKDSNYKNKNLVNKNWKLKGDGFIKVEKDDINNLKNKFKQLYINKESEYEIIDGKKEKYYEPTEIPMYAINDLLISDYANTSTSEAYAEYFSFYISNKKYLDKKIKLYNNNPISFCKNENIKDWFKYTKPRDSLIKKETSYNKSKEANNKYYENVVDLNINILKKVKSIVDRI